ncbi:hypothetical protein RHS01_06109 [Rhizoctonia solani]|uniref:Uncharacterized protein n=1 Tax=Rhizoctonia solani TaxID=456999 RepID=A0A8H7M4N8_9AGAM|nr:hypothetical protein RHS01_06109 [Rhizoctonia solani]
MNSNKQLNLAEDGSSSEVIHLDTTVSPTPLKTESDVSQPVDLSAVAVMLQNDNKPSIQDIEKSTNEKPSAVSAPAPKPKPRFVPASRWIRFQLWFNTYRKFFTFIILFELAGMITAGLGHFPYAHENTGGIVIGNILAGVVVRNELFGRLLYLIVNTFFAKWTPLWFRLACTSVLQHLGVSTRAAHVFERNHRFFGWAAVIVTWIYIILENGYRNSRSSFAANSYAFAHHQELWLSIFMAIAVILPWTYTRKVPIHVEIPSPKVAVLRFDRGLQQGLLGRISRTAVLEYHAFGTISEGKDAKHHYMVCGVQGDFTRSLVNDMPTHIWTREVKFAGVGNTSTLYRRGIRICTGTGIGAALSTCLQSDQWFLIWIGSDVLKTFGPTIAELIERGTMELLAEQFYKWNAEGL